MGAQTLPFASTPPDGPERPHTLSQGRNNPHPFLSRTSCHSAGHCHGTRLDVTEAGGIEDPPRAPVALTPFICLRPAHSGQLICSQKSGFRSSTRTSYRSQSVHREHLMSHSTSVLIHLRWSDRHSSNLQALGHMTHPYFARERLSYDRNTLWLMYLRGKERQPPPSELPP